MSSSQTIEGIWETYDDASGELKSEVKIYIKDGKLYGKIIKLYNLDVDPKDAKCELCTDYRKDKPVIGMLVMTGLKKSGEEWVGNSALLDPNNGKSYDAKIWLEGNNKLAVRGYIGWFFRTQYWKKK
ncbi:MAG TPA: DUF2147 domain-containing protein [Brumimicrobium sp.]|nr:DUF2147 domain-containing protein [Brumimicrobium sp.]